MLVGAAFAVGWLLRDAMRVTGGWPYPGNATGRVSGPWQCPVGRAGGYSPSASATNGGVDSAPWWMSAV